MPNPGPSPLHAAILARAQRWIFDRTVAIYVRQPEGNPRQWGSGVLLQINEEDVFLVSASHVIEMAREGELLIGSMSPEARDLVLLGQSVRIRTTDTQKVDVAVVRLSASAIETLAPFKHAQHIARLDSSRALPQGCYYVAGYPLEITTTDHVARAITIGGYTLTTYLVESDNAHRGVSIALAHNREHSVVRGSDGELTRAPHLEGISGCGIWRLWSSDQEEQLEAWDESWICLVGIEHRITKTTVIGTMAFHVFEMLARTQPTQLSVTSRGIKLSFPCQGAERAEGDLDTQPAPIRVDSIVSERDE